MPQAAWEALPWDADQGLRPPHTPKTLRLRPQASHPQAWAIGAAKPPPHPTTTTPGRERAKGGPAATGRGEAQGSRQAPTGTGHRGRHSTGARNHQRARKRKGTEGEGVTVFTRAHTQEGHTTTERPPPPHPQPTPPDCGRRTPAKTRRHSMDPTPHEPQRLAPTDYRAPHKARRAHPHEEKRLHPPREQPRTPPHSPPHRQATTPATTRATTQATAQAPEEEQDTAATPRTGDGKEAEGHDRRGVNRPVEATTPQPTEPDTPLGARNPRGHGTKAQAPREDLPADTHPTHRAKWLTRTPATRIQRATLHLTVPPNHQPAT